MNNVKKMNNLFEYTYILILVCPRQKLSPKNVSNSSQNIQELFIGAFSVHFIFEWVFWILFWIESWIGSFLGPIQ